MTDAADLIACAEIWNRFYPSKFRVSYQTIAQCLGSSSVISSSVHLSVSEGRFSSLKVSGTPSLFPGQDPKRGHIALLAVSDPSLLDSEIRSLVDEATEAGLERLVFGMDTDHLLPGVPEEMSKLLSALTASGFVETGRCFDLERDLSDYVLPDVCREAMNASGAAVRPCQTADIDALDRFLQAEFPSRWRHDVLRKVVQDGEAEQVYLLLVNGEVEGFALTQQEGCKRPISGANWRESLGEKWGALGPIGVSKNVRGKGLGNALLGYALRGLQERGARQTIIDWTTLGDFYGSHGFVITRRYVQLSRNLAPLS